MACGTGFCAGKIIATIVAVGVGGYATFNYATTGCVLGSCDSEVVATDASVQGVSAEGTEALSACCSAKPECDGSDCGTGCDDCATDAALVEAAATTGAAEGCTEDAAACSEGKTCPLTGETILEVAATDSDACEKSCEDKTECHDDAQEVAVDSDAQESDG